MINSKNWYSFVLYPATHEHGQGLAYQDPQVTEGVVLDIERMHKLQALKTQKGVRYIFCYVNR